jgi:uncharacterized protein
MRTNGLGGVSRGGRTQQMSAEAIAVDVGAAVLAGTIWTPPVPAAASMLMWPGSGPSDRDNGGYFRPIREHLVAHGVVVCSFDKRGVVGSSGRWQDAGIVEQADDLLAALSWLGSHDAWRGPVGLFGHSQGGWVVVEAASRGPGIDFAVANSGPGVSPREQERYALRTKLKRLGKGEVEIQKACDTFHGVADLLSNDVVFEEALTSLEELGIEVRGLGEIGFPLEGAREWRFYSMTIDYDPRPALARISVPLLAVFGEEDAVVPVDASLVAYRAAVPRELLTVQVFAGGDHRIQCGSPSRLVPGYLAALTSFIERVTRS